MPNDPIAHSEMEALTRRVQAVEDRTEALQVQTGGNFAAVIEGQAALRREMREGFASTNARMEALDGRMEALTEEVRAGNARIIELLSGLIGRNPD